MRASRAEAVFFRGVLGALLGCSAGCSVVTDFDGYRAGLAPARPLAVFRSFRFERGPASFSVSGADGLLAQSGRDERVVPGSQLTTAGGVLDLDATGGFAYSPPGEPGAFWGDDYFEYALEGSRDARARVRLTVQPDTLQLTELAGNPGAGFGVAGAVAEDAVGTTVIASAGDVNGDGLEDFVLSAMGPKTYYDGTPAPVGPGRAAYVLFGKRDGAGESLADLEGDVPKGFAIVGDENEDTLDAFGFRVAGVGDANGDGFDDIIVSSFAYDPALTPDSLVTDFIGAAYVVFGKADAAPVKSADLRAGLGGGFAILPRDGQYRLVGLDVRGAGDVNGDGLDDVIVGAPVVSVQALVDGQGTGAAYVIFGKAGPAPVWLEDVAAAQSGGFAIASGVGEEFAGFLVTGVGDVNADGLDDVAAYSPLYVGSEGSAGRTVVVFGKLDLNPVELTTLAENPGTGFSILGTEELSDWKLAAGGDVNGDGLDDMLIGHPQGSLRSSLPEPEGTPEGAEAVAAPEYGVVYVVFGKRELGDVALRALEEDPSLGFTLTGAQPSQKIGFGLSAGDINADGLSDVITASALLDGLGEAYVVFGKKDMSGVVPLAYEQLAPDVGLAVFPDGPEGGGVTVSGSDANGDGIDDLLVSALLYDPAPQLAGGVYVAFGWDMTGALAGRDRALIGGSGDDQFELPENDVVIVRGGNGTDALHVGSRAAPLDLTVPGRYESIEVIDVRGGGPQVVVLDDAALRRIPQNRAGFAFGLARRLTVLGDAEDTLQLDMAGFSVVGAGGGRTVYGRAGVYYGLEISDQLSIPSL